MAVVLFTIIPVTGAPQPARPVNDGNADFTRDIDYIYSEYSKELSAHKQWNVLVNGTRFKAFHYDRYNNKHSLLTIDIEASRKQGYDLFIITTNINETSTAKALKIPTESKVPREKLLKNIIGTYLVMKTFDFRKETKRRSEIAFHPSISFGFSTTSDWDRRFPEYRGGPAFISVSGTYDPTLELLEENMALSTGDYLAFRIFVAFDTKMRENLVDLNMLLFGYVNSFEALGSRVRLLHGFFVGYEYFRPSYNVTTMQLNQTITGDSIAFQFLSAKLLQYGLVTSFGEKHNQAVTLMAGAGPSINSSLIATARPAVITPGYEDIFLSVREQQNYYYSLSLPLSLSYRVRRVYGFTVGAEYNLFYFTYWDLQKKADDLVNVVKFDVGYNVFDDFFIGAGYEYWHISSRLSNERLSHSWNRVILELRYLI